ncbi:MAG: thiamine phosphate synthase [Candidatus Ancillula sp.]|jgi:thiamine-phosphate diphosphorylase|nr:thiamine phosphate synthase [Candidatus Ancillula sp.]
MTKFDLSAYLVLGEENTLGRPVEKIVKEAIEGGVTFVQLRSKVSSAKALIEQCGKISKVLKEFKSKTEKEVAFVVDDRLDVILAARDLGYKVDGIHVGQTDIPVSICRKLLGPDSIVGLSAPTQDLISYVQNIDISPISYFGAGPLHPTETKKDCGLNIDGTIITQTLDEIDKLGKVSPLPVVVGGGVKLADIPDLAKTAIAGWFVVSAIAGAKNPKQATEELVQAWNANRK